MTSYTGKRTPDGRQVFVEDNGRKYPLPLRDDLTDHSREFEWGYMGSGPAQLALALLAHHTKNGEYAIKLHQDFKNEKIAGWDADEWTITADELDAWLVNKPDYTGKGFDAYREELAIFAETVNGRDFDGLTAIQKDRLDEYSRLARKYNALVYPNSEFIGRYMECTAPRTNVVIQILDHTPTDKEMQIFISTHSSPPAR